MKKLILAVTVLAALTSCSKTPKANYKEVSRPCSTQISTTATTTVIKATSTATTQTTTTTTAETTSMTETEPITTVEITTSEAVTDVVEQPVTEWVEPETEPTTAVSSAEYLGEWQAVWYCGHDMGYSYNPCGASGNQLVSGYSVACDNLPFGTRLLIECEYFTKEVRVDDCGVGVSNVLDLYYFDRSEIPDGLKQAGRIPIRISIIN